MFYQKSFESPVISAFLAQDLAALLCRPEAQLMGFLPDEVFHRITESSLRSTLQKPPASKAQDPSYGDVCLPCFQLARGHAPHDISTALARTIKELINSSPSLSLEWLGGCHALGGFLNFDLHTDRLMRFVAQNFDTSESIISTIRLHACESPSDQPVMIEYSQPNTHKEFHIGHCRNVCLGLCLSRIYQLLGYEVIQVNYIGDEGTHVAKCLWQLQKQPSVDVPDHMSASQWYNTHYVAATALAETSFSAAAEISAILAELEAKQGDFYELWKDTKTQCLADFNEVYDWLGVHFDHVYFESDLTRQSQELVDEYLDKGVFCRSDGAIGCDLSDENLGFMMVRKSDGHSLYITKDLALAHRKNQDYPHLGCSMIVVGSEQDFHFKQLFAALKIMGSSSPVHQHISYGMVVLKHGKMASRKGNVVGFWPLISQIGEALEQPLHELKQVVDGGEYEQIKKQLVMGSLMFGMLSQDPQRKLIFDIASFTQAEGKTGPYLMYAYTRAQSVLNKRHSQISLTTPVLRSQYHRTEKQLLIQLMEFIDVTCKACDHQSPAMICHYLYELCRVFSRFYTSCPILNETDVDIQTSRLILTDRFCHVLECGLYMMGIKPPQKM